MVIAHNISAINTYNKMGISSSATDKSMEKLSSGFKINRAADDAAGLSISEKMRSQIRGLNQASENAQNGISMIQTAEGALNESHSILQRMRELAVQSANDTNAASDREALQSEIDQLTSEINRIGNTTEFNGMKILNGSKITTTGKEEIEVVSGTKAPITLAVGTAGAKNTAGLELEAGITIANPDPTEGVDYTSLQAAEGKNVIEISQEDGNLIVNINLVQSGTNPPDEGIQKLKVEAEKLVKNSDGDWVYNNHGITFTVTAESATKYLTNGSSKQVASIDLFKATGSDATNVVNAASTYDIQNDYEDDSSFKGTITGLKLAAYGDGTARLNYDRVEIEYQNAATDAAASLTVKYFSGSDQILTDTINVKGAGEVTANTGADIYKYDSNGLSFVLHGDKGFGVADKIHAIIDFNAELGTETVQGSGTAADNSVYFHVGANTNQVINTTFSDMRAHALGLTGSGDEFTEEYTVNNGTDSTNTERGLNIATRSGANSAIDIIDNAISIVSAERSKYGAIQNRLEYTINNLDTTSENMTSSESTIRDTDMASEMMEMTKNNILQQASQAMLSQSMQRPQQVLQLLQ